jgi:RecA/RadA recombinase
MNPLMKKMLAASTVKNSAIMSESVMFNQRDVISTDIPIINAAFSGSVNGGIHSGLILAAGPSKSFKTMLGLVCIKAYLNKYDDAVAVILDSEGGITPDYLAQNGVDASKVIHVPVEHLEMVKFELVNQLKQINRGDHVIFMIDSIGNTASIKELEDAENEKTVGDMTRAKTVKSLFRMVTPSLVAKDIPCIAICHTYEEIGAMYSKTIIAGGCMVAGTNVIMHDGSLKAIQEVEIGDYVLTLEGGREVSSIWNPETLENGTPECFEIEFDDGFKVTVSDEHQFLTTSGWVAAKYLTEETIIISI